MRSGNRRDWNLKRLQALGIDLGSTRVRVAVSVRTAEHRTRLHAIASRDLPDPAWSNGGSALDFAAMILEQLVREMGVRKRECVTALGCPQTTLRTVRFPKMTWLERRRAARFEAPREGAEHAVRVHPIDRRKGVFAIAIVDPRLSKRHAELLRKAGLRLLAVDHDAYALRRVLPEYDAIADVGYETMRLHVFADDGMSTWSANVGGNTVTRGIAADLAIDAQSAERRKRIVGTSGAGSSGLETCVRELSSLLDRASGSGKLKRLALVGNGARLPGFAGTLVDCTGLHVEFPVADALRSGGFSDEVLQVASPDWTLAAALSGWEAA